MVAERSGRLRLGIYGGTFNPVHYGHLLNAESIREEFNLDRVIFIPSKIPVHKTIDSSISGDDRFEDIESLSYKRNGQFVHNPRGELLDLSHLKLPIRDKRRLTWGYHIMNYKIEVCWFSGSYRFRSVMTTFSLPKRFVLIL